MSSDPDARTDEDSTSTGDDGRCPVTTVADFYDYAEIGHVLRSKAVVQNPDANADNLVRFDPIGNVNAREYFDGILDQENGADHRRRRKLLNSLVRPESLDRIREEIVLPSVHRNMQRTLRETATEGVHACDLAELLDRTFLEFSAKLIGLQGVDTEEGIQKLRTCVHPIFAGMISRYFEDREAVLEAGLQAKRDFTEFFYRPSRTAFDVLLEQVERGELTESDLPLNLMRFIGTSADPSYEDEALAIREAILFFIAAAGTSTQSILSTVHELAQWFDEHPDDRHLAEDSEFLAMALQEAMRLKAPFIEYQIRQAAEEFVVGDRVVQQGQEIHLHFPHADRDRSLFGEDAGRFNPRREVAPGVPRYGLAFASGPHQCFGLRIVLGNDGHGGSHVHTLKTLFQAGIRPDPDNAPTTLPMIVGEGDLSDLANYTTYPVLFTNWDPASASLG